MERATHEFACHTCQKHEPCPESARLETHANALTGAALAKAASQEVTR
jgi:hypothetical protein